MKKLKDNKHNYNNIVTDKNLLTVKCSDVDLYSSSVQKKVKEVIYKMKNVLTYDLPLSYGLSAIQVGSYLNLFILRNASTKDFSIYINAKILNKKGIIISNEGCDSLLGERYFVLRPKEISVGYYTLDGDAVVTEYADRLLCRCISHEIDHQNGILICKKGVHINKIWLKQQ